MDIRLLARRHMNRRATAEQVEFLQENIEEWRRELIKLLNIYHSELLAIRERQAADAQKYGRDLDLQIQAFQAWEKKRLKVAQQLRRAEYDLTLIDQQRQVQVGPPMSERERFLVAAIEAHRDFSEEVRPVDEHLYAALDGKWTYTELPGDLPWNESE